MHDKNGKPLAVGDRVTVTATIKETYLGEEYCNVQLETEEPMYPGDNKTIITLNAKQVEKQE